MKKTAAMIFLAATALLIGACSVSAEQASEGEGVDSSLEATEEVGMPVSTLSDSPLPAICFNGCNRFSCKKPLVKASCIAACPANLIRECKKA